MAWQLQQAKQRFSEVVRRAQTEGDQIVTKHGRPAVVVVDFEGYRATQRQANPTTLADHLLNAPRLADEAWEAAYWATERPTPIRDSRYKIEEDPDWIEADL